VANRTLRSYLAEGWSVIREAARRWLADRAARLGAALAFYTIFSLGPVLIIVLTIAGVVFSPAAARNAVLSQAQNVLGSGAAATIASVIQSARQPAGNIGTALLSGVALAASATAFFTSIKGALNTIWRAEPIESPGVWNVIRSRGLSLLLVVFLSLIVILLLVTDTALLFASRYLGDLVPWLKAGAVRRTLQLVFSVLVVRFGLVALLVAVMFKVLPDVRITWKDVRAGAIITSLLLLLGQIVIARILQATAITSAYGAAGSFVTLLLWVYYSAQVFFFGAELTYVYSARYGSRIAPDAVASPFSDEDEVGAEPERGSPTRQ
jgi:membrane protein